MHTGNNAKISSFFLCKISNFFSVENPIISSNGKQKAIHRNLELFQIRKRPLKTNKIKQITTYQPLRGLDRPLRLGHQRLQPRCQRLSALGHQSELQRLLRLWRFPQQPLRPDGAGRLGLQRHQQRRQR